MAKEKVRNGPSLEDGSRGDLIDTFKEKPADIVSNAEAKSAEVQQKFRSSIANDTEWGFDAMKIAQDAYEDSMDFMESSLRKRWEESEKQFNNRHPVGSKYYSDAYKAKSRLFRPKTRAAIRQAEAQAAASFFANEDVARVQPADPDNPMQAAGAAVLHEVLKVRLSTPNERVAIPWFMTLVGAYQDVQKNGIVISKQWWEYRETEYVEETPYQTPTGETRMMREKKTKPIIDRPRCDILAPENVLIDRGASWIDPIGTSPFVILKMPMYIHEVEDRMSQGFNKTGLPAWNYAPRSVLLTAKSGRESSDSTRQAREGNQQDSKDSEIATEEYTVVWIHENIIRWEDTDWVYWTVGDRHLLTDPLPLQDVYPYCEPGERPVRMGQCVIETNRLYPSGKPELTRGLQSEANEVVNQRLDNVKLALNKRYLVKRGKQTDLRSLLRNVAGSVTLTSEPDEDVKVLETRDVTASSYQEQDRINADFDEIAGSFSVGSVGTNRNLGETVGGMSLISGAANSLGELDLRVFTESWVQPVLSQIVRMEQHFENDKAILTVAGKKAQLWTQFRQSVIDDDLLMQDMVVKVDVGIGATDPMQRLQKFQVAAKAIKEIFGEALAPNMEAEEIVKEIMSMLGYRDGRRFFNFEKGNPYVTQLKGKIEELERKLETKELDRQARVETARMGGLSRIIAQSIDSEQRAQQHAQDGVRDFEMEEMRLGADAQNRERELAMSEEEHAMNMRHMSERQALDNRSKMIDIYTQHALGNQKLETTQQMAEIKAEQMRSQAAAKGEGGGGKSVAKPKPAPKASPPALPTMPQQTGPDPLAGIAEALMQQTQMMQQTAQMVMAAVESANQPKMIIRDQQGRATGVQTGGGQNA